MALTTVLRTNVLHCDKKVRLFSVTLKCGLQQVSHTAGIGVSTVKWQPGFVTAITEIQFTHQHMTAMCSEIRHTGVMYCLSVCVSA